MSELSSTPSIGSFGRIERSLPYSEEAEKGVLGSILLESLRVLDLCYTRGLTPEAFYVPAHREIFEAMTDMWRKGVLIDILTVAERLASTGKLERVGGRAYLERIVDSTPTAAHAEYYIDIVFQKYLLRSIIAKAREAENYCYTTEENALSVLDKVEQMFMAIGSDRYGSTPSWKDAIHDAIQHVEQILNSRTGLRGVSTGFLNIDKILQGLRPGEMIVLAARPGMGKTSLAMNIAENVALGKGDPEGKKRAVGIFSLEMAMETLVLRMLCSHAEVSLHKLTRGYISAQNDHAKLIEAANVLSQCPIFLDDTGGLDVLELRARARRMKMKHDIQLLVIDYLQLLHAREYERQGRQLETAYISGQIKAMAKELKIPVLVLSQLSRAPEHREGKPRLSDLRDSGAIEQDADVVCLLRRPSLCQDDEEAEDQSLAIVEVAKHRNGPLGDIKLNFEPEYTRFRDREPGVDRIPVTEEEVMEDVLEQE